MVATMKTGQTEAVRIVRHAWAQASGHDGPAAAILWSALTYLNSTDPDRAVLTGLKRQMWQPIARPDDCPERDALAPLDPRD
jgi:hypothetical protein